MNNSSQMQIENCTVCAGTGAVKRDNNEVTCNFCGGSGKFGTDGEVEYLIQIDPQTDQPMVIGVRPKGLVPQDSDKSSSLYRQKRPLLNWVHCGGISILLVEIIVAVFAYLFLAEIKIVAFSVFLIILTFVGFLLLLSLNFRGQGSEPDFISVVKSKSKKTMSDEKDIID
jgi:hypothetical protein